MVLALEDQVDHTNVHAQVEAATQATALESNLNNVSSYIMAEIRNIMCQLTKISQAEKCQVTSAVEHVIGQLRAFSNYGFLCFGHLIMRS